METLKRLILFSLIVSYASCYSQDIKMNKDVEEMIALGKDSIVQLALKKIDKKMNKEGFTKVKTLTNGEEILIYFSNPIEYLPKEDVFYFGAKINLLSKKIYYNTLVYRSLDYNGNKTVLLNDQTKETKENVMFVLEALNDPKYSGSIDIVSFKNGMIINEYENYYSVSIFSESYESDFKMDKVLGNVYDEVNFSIEPDPFGDPLSVENINEYKEIDWGRR